MKKVFKLVLVIVILAVAVFAHTPTMPKVVYANAPAEAGTGLVVTAKAAFLIEANSGKVLFSKNENAHLPIASMVKITTLALIYDALERGQIKLGDEVMVSRNASGMGGSQAFLDFDSVYKVEDLVKSIIVASANDSCVAMAELINGSEEEFVLKMNELAARLDMANTNYINCTGLPAANSYSCASDVAKVYAYMMKSPYYGMFDKIWMYDLTHPSGRVTGLTNTNKHVRFYSDCTGGKTGFTAEAGHCITVTANRRNLKPVAVIIGAADSKTRFAESANLMNHVFNSYENKQIVNRDTIQASVKLRNAAIDNIDVFACENFFDLRKKGEKTAPEIKIELNKEIKAPFKSTDALGKIVVTDNGKVIREIDLIAGKNIDGLSYWGCVKKVLSNYKF